MRKMRLFSLLVVLALVLSACGGGPAAVEQPAAAEQPAQQEAAPAQEAAAPGDGGLEAPALAEKVAAGELPPLAERLPKDPKVIGPGVLISEEDLPDWQPGQYGGTINTAHSVADWAPDVFVMLNEPLLQAPGLSVQNIQGNVLKDFEVSDDNTTFTFYMREGMKWSDGEPVTTEDVRFTWENIYNNEQLSPSGIKARFRTGYDPAGDPGQLEILDDFTFKLTFSQPYGGFLRNITIEGWNGYTELVNPAHILKQYHPDFTPMEELQPLLAENNLTDEWWQLFTQKRCENWHATADRCIGFPTLNPWISVVSDTPGVKVFERNPYYFKVDTEGKQLPYIDKIVSVQVEDVEMVNQRVLTGDIDFLRESTGLVKVPLYKENEERAGFNTVLLDMHVDSSMIRLNQTFDDPTWRQLAQDVRFRQALSLALDRQEIIDSIYYGFASLPLVSVGEEFSQRDLERANALLDELGMTERDADGFRLSPEGQPFSILLEHGAQAPDLEPVAELVAEHLKDVGLNVQVRRIDASLFGQRNNANELQMSVGWSHDQGWDSDWTGGTIERGVGRAWWLWHTSGGAEGEEPPQWVKDVFALDAQRWSAVSGSDEYNQLREDGYAWSRANLPLIQIVEQVKYPMIANKNLRNVPQGGYAIAANFAGEQLWYAP
ncbi:MAG: ABC transporter substrate-binding protein [Chloroflexi bacterium]|nr:MAG: ABC transporter substrate-binding protein [Chloroflexota bacterium]